MLYLASRFWHSTTLFKTQTLALQETGSYRGLLHEPARRLRLLYEARLTSISLKTSRIPVQALQDLHLVGFSSSEDIPLPDG